MFIRCKLNRISNFSSSLRLAAILICIISLLSVVMLTSCESDPAKDDGSDNINDSTNDDANSETITEAASGTDAVTDETDTKTETQSEEDVLLRKAYNVYQKILYDFMFDYILPDGTKLESEDETSIRNNKYTAVDVDGDGSKELIVSYVTGPTASNTEFVYDYDAATDSAHLEVILTPDAVFYDNGIIIAKSSHNHSLGMELWPYDLYKYNRSSADFLYISERRVKPRYAGQVQRACLESVGKKVRNILKMRNAARAAAYKRRYLF